MAQQNATPPHLIITEADHAALKEFSEFAKPVSQDSHSVQWHATTVYKYLREAYMYATRLTLVHAEGSIELASAKKLQSTLLWAGRSARTVRDHIPGERAPEDDFLEG